MVKDAELLLHPLLTGPLSEAMSTGDWNDAGLAAVCVPLVTACLKDALTRDRHRLLHLFIGLPQINI